MLMQEAQWTGKQSTADAGGVLVAHVLSLPAQQPASRSSSAQGAVS